VADNEGINQNQTVSSDIDQRLQTKLISDTIRELEGCQAFASWVGRQELDYVLGRSGLRTLFAPRDEAFQPPASADPEEYLNGHLLTGASETFDLSRCTSIKSLAGETLPVSDGGMRVGPARIVRADIPCTNGVIHIVDAELLAPNAT
jgi:uncharacterized surface protein with fasciclin (FAS1) repeats